MTKQMSYTKIENDILPKFRKNMNLAESTEDVKKFFSYAMQELLGRVFSDDFMPTYDDIQLQPGHSPPYLLSDAICQLEKYTAIWDHSDLAEILLRFAKMANHRYDHLEKKPEKTEAKIRM
ncbi:hypothetical protein [Desulfogranum japonicum]|uniref:hypothetical protein n=1 Tax=Desulfogranum japonicum TaxID=231447 RepID=UPI0004079004|nr:hypothetical protein [Desulfogranum japonicum]